MKKVITLGAVALMALASGCSKDKKPTASTSEPKLTEVAPPQPQHQAATPPANTATPPGYTDPGPVAQADAPTGGNAASQAGGKYTVKRGDTLWSIAQRTYGDGKQYKRIVAANPGLQPQKLAAGQTILLP